MCTLPKLFLFKFGTPDSSTGHIYNCRSSQSFLSLLFGEEAAIEAGNEMIPQTDLSVVVLTVP